MRTCSLTETLHVMTWRQLLLWRHLGQLQLVLLGLRLLNLDLQHLLLLLQLLQLLLHLLVEVRLLLKLLMEHLLLMRQLPLHFLLLLRHFLLLRLRLQWDVRRLM